MLGIWTADPAVPAGVEDLAHLDAGGDQLVPGGLDVGNDQVQVLGRSGRGRRAVRAELDRARGAGRRELDNAGRRVVQPPPKSLVELLRAVEVRDGDGDYLELHVHDVGSFLVKKSPCARTDRVFPLQSD